MKRQLLIDYEWPGDILSQSSRSQGAYCNMSDHQIQITELINRFEGLLIDTGLFDSSFFTRSACVSETLSTNQIRKLAESSKLIGDRFHALAELIRTNIVNEIQLSQQSLNDPDACCQLAKFLARIIEGLEDVRNFREIAQVYGDLLSMSIMFTYRSAAPGRENLIVRKILMNIASRKAVELNEKDVLKIIRKLRNTITVAIISKRYAVYVLAVRGLEVLFRAEIDFITYGTSPEGLALQIASIMLKNGIKLVDVTDVVCGGGDIGTVPDGIYVLTEKVRDESWKRLHNSSLNRGALVGWELADMLRKQRDRGSINASICSPLSFSTLASYGKNVLFRSESNELRQSLRGYVKVTPLKSIAALISQIKRVKQQNLNLLVLTLDELFASVIRKSGHRIIREIIAQDANRILLNFDFDKIVERLQSEGFTIPSNFRLASREIGTGVMEICELLMIIESGKISRKLASSLMHVVDSYARSTAMALEMCSAGEASERPHYIAITSMQASDRYFQQLFDKIRDRVDNPFTPILCIDSLEHEYLIANHIFEMYVNPAKGESRLNYGIEARSMNQALQVLGTVGTSSETFSFSKLLDDVTGAIKTNALKPGKLVLVGADNDDALLAVANAKEYGLLDKISLIGDPAEITESIQKSKAQISPSNDPDVQLIPIDPLATDMNQKQESMAQEFHKFLKANPDYIVMKGSVDTSHLLKVALSIYKTDEGTDGKPPERKTASWSGLIVFPDNRFFALSDPAVNPAFTKASTLLKAIENQLDVVRRVVSKTEPLRLAIITAVEKETSAIPATLMAAEAEQASRSLEEKYGPLVIEGPLSFDLATVPEVACEKHYQGKIMGNANCLVATEINTANVIYKMLSKTMGSLGLVIEIGGIITAGPNTSPIVLTSRGDTAQTKFNSILLAMAYAVKIRDMDL